MNSISWDFFVKKSQQNLEKILKLGDTRALMKTFLRSLAALAFCFVVAAVLSGCSGGSNTSRTDPSVGQFTFSDVSGTNANTSSISFRRKYDDDTDSGVYAETRNNNLSYMGVYLPPNSVRAVEFYVGNENLATLSEGTTFSLDSNSNFYLFYAENNFSTDWISTSGTATVVSNRGGVIRVRFDDATMTPNDGGSTGTFTLDGTLVYRTRDVVDGRIMSVNPSAATAAVSNKGAGQRK